MKQAIDYLREVFSDKLDVQPVSQREMDAMPLYIGAMYTLWKALLADVKIYLVEPIGNELSTPSQLKKHQEIIAGKAGCPVVFLFDRIESYNRNRLIQQKIDFVTTDKQIFMPSLLIRLKEYASPIVSKKRKIQPAAQCLLLFHLQKQNLNGLGFHKIADFFPYSYLTITRAVNNLAEVGLCEIEGTKEKTIFFNANKPELWQNALNLLANPVKRSVFINEDIPEHLAVKTNINALAHFTLLNNEPKIFLAIWEKNFRILHKESRIKMFSHYDGEFVVEQWSYDPVILSYKGFVDPLSLYLMYRDDTDERVNYEINQMIKGIQWLEV